MGLFWDLIQQSQISDTTRQVSSVDGRLSRLEQELRQTQQLLHEALKRLETTIGEDLNRDGRVG